jgi:hypothetical protein
VKLRRTCTLNSLKGVDPKHPELVCNLRKSMYGLKQAGRDWYKHLDDILVNLGLNRGMSDPCLYYHENKRLFVTVYVDDLGIWGDEPFANSFVKRI